MGVTCVYSYPVPEGKSGQTVVETLQRQIELLGAVKAGHFCVDCDIFQSILQSSINAQPKTVYILHNSEQPASCFAITDTGLCLTADTLFDGLMNKLKNYYQQRKNARMEAKGQRYELGDFILKVGSVSLAGSFKGIIVEVEYCPCVVAVDCWGLMKELLQSVMGSVAEAPPPVLKNKQDELYSPSITMAQYLDIFNNFRKLAAAAPLGR
ncbi:mediator of RNA polymerase II transcription subunit 20-like isoform X2 [Babylonia areolata]|uniref:mediator of RNA polymerase II transcription subunit 20-like isoform X2 n=1 Tax=Babylonia areolata TaxID=304850 RepID=UPI003FCEE6D3